MKVEWTVPRRFPTVNDWHGKPHHVYRKIAGLWLREFPPTTALTRAAGRRSVRIIRVFPKKRGQKRYDPDNLVGGAKPVLDALVAHRWLAGDSPEHLELHVEQRHAADGEQWPATIVTLEDVATR